MHAAVAANAAAGLLNVAVYVWNPNPMSLVFACVSIGAAAFLAGMESSSWWRDR